MLNMLNMIFIRQAF